MSFCDIQNLSQTDKYDVGPLRYNVASTQPDRDHCMTATCTNTCPTTIYGLGLPYAGHFVVES